MPLHSKTKKKKKPRQTRPPTAVAPPLTLAHAVHWAVTVYRKQATLTSWVPDDASVPPPYAASTLETRGMRVLTRSHSERYGAWFTGYSVDVAKWGWSSARQTYYLWSTAGHIYSAQVAHLGDGKTAPGPRQVYMTMRSIEGRVPVDQQPGPLTLALPHPLPGEVARKRPKLSTLLPLLSLPPLPPLTANVDSFIRYAGGDPGKPLKLALTALRPGWGRVP
jgi:hypothetical protein